MYLLFWKVENEEQKLTTSKEILENIRVTPLYFYVKADTKVTIKTAVMCS